jgi:histidinol-phosphate aminotransferase
VTAPVRLDRARRAVREMTAYTLALRTADVKLNQNESPYDFPDDLKSEVLRRAAGRPWNIYPEFESLRLRAAIGESYGIPTDGILVGNGSNELLGVAIGTFVEPGVPVVFPSPTFTLYEKLVTVAGGTPVPIAFDPASGQLPMDELLREVDIRPNAVVIVCSPNNPTGSVLPRGGLQSLVDSGALILFDRAYGDFHTDPFPQVRENLVVFSTFSKAWGLASLRLGWVASTADNSRQMRKVKLPYSLNAISEETAIVALENDAYRSANVASIVVERSRLVAAMSAMAGIVTFPSAANFVTFRPQMNSRLVFEELCADGLLIRDVSAYPGLGNSLRVSVGSAEQNDRFLHSLKRITGAG